MSEIEMLTLNDVPAIDSPGLATVTELSDPDATIRAALRQPVDLTPEQIALESIPDAGQQIPGVTDVVC